MHHPERAQTIAEIEQQLSKMTEDQKSEVLGFLRMIAGKDPGVEPKIILRMHRTLIVCMRRNGDNVPDEILPRLSAMVQEILDGVPSVRDRYILRSFYLLGDDTNKYRVEDALKRSGVVS